MAIVCPQCAAPAVDSLKAVSAAGRMLRCPRCGAAWLPRTQAGGRAGQSSLPSARKTSRPRFERIIEHFDADLPGRASPRAKKPAEPELPPSAWRRLSFATPALRAWSGAAAIVLIVLVAIVGFDPSVVGATPDDGTAQFTGIEVKLVRSTAKRLLDGNAVVVLGEITNRTNDEIAVPAVRLSVRSEGAELYSWIVEPTKTQLAGGGALQFRSLSAAPLKAFDEVALRFVNRRGTPTGAR